MSKDLFKSIPFQLRQAGVWLLLHCYITLAKVLSNSSRDSNNFVHVPNTYHRALQKAGTIVVEFSVNSPVDHENYMVTLYHLRI